MSLRLGALSLILASGAGAEGPRIAVYPLDASELDLPQLVQLRGVFEVSIARVPHIRLAGSGGVEAALRSPAATGCEIDDGCMRSVARATQSLYTVYARLRPDAVGREFTITARVVRADGEVVRRLSLNAPKVKDLDPLQTATELVRVAVTGLELGTLEDALPDQAAAQLTNAVDAAFSPPPLPLPGALEPGHAAEEVAVEPISLRRMTGFTMFGVGLATAAAGGTMLGFATAARGPLRVDANGAVAPEQAARAAEAARTSLIATVVLPVGLGLGVVGGLLAWWPEQRGARVAVVASPESGGVVVSGPLP